MPEPYLTNAGDTWELVSGMVYGVFTRADDIARANPGLTSPLPGAVPLVIPEDAPRTIQDVKPGRDDQAVLVVEGVEFRHWESFSITRRIDSASTFQCVTPTRDDPSFRKAFRPLTWPKCEVRIGVATVLTGFVSESKPVSETIRRTTIGGYGLPGILGDTMMPDNFEGRLFRKETVEAIAKKVTQPWGISVVVDAGVDVGEPFRRCRIEPGTTVLDFLTELAKERGVMFRDNAKGELVITDGGEPGRPVTTIERGRPPYMAGEIDIKPQEWYSHVIGFRSGHSGKFHTEKNTLLTTILKPFAYRVSRSEGRELPITVATKRGRMMTTVLTMKCKVATWFDPNGELWEPGTTINLVDRALHLDNPFEWTIQQVISSVSAKGERVAEMELVLPGAFRGDAPAKLPWG